MSAERGWMAEPPPQRDWHTPGWLCEKGSGRSHFRSAKYAANSVDTGEAGRMTGGPSITGRNDRE